jgi:hypothetical protein
MFHQYPPRHEAVHLFALALFLWGALLLLAPPRALAQPAAGTQAPPAFKPDAGFLKDDPHRKTKQVVRLTGVKSEAELAIVRGAINDVIGFVRLFGITGSNLGNAKLSSVSPEELEKIKAARVTWDAFARMSTPRGRQSMPIEPASGHMTMAMDEWAVESDSALSVRTDFRMTSFELKMVKDPVPQVHRLHFVKQDGKWLFDRVSP